MGMLVFVSILFGLLLMKWYLVAVYVPLDEDNNADILANLENTFVEPTQYDTQQGIKKSAEKVSRKSNKKRENPSRLKGEKPQKASTLFYFDPNTISGDSMKLLGLSHYVVNNITKYRTKGGKFRHAADLKKIYGMDSLQFEKVHPYIKIKASNPKTYPVEKKEAIAEVASRPPLEKKSVDINVADTTELKKLNGIGSVYAKRIVKFRNSLGGYFTVDQIKEVWGISDSLFVSIKPFLTVDTSLLIKQNINKLDKATLVRHPYMNWSKAKLILKYKKMHGDYQSMDDFHKMHGLSAAFADTLTHYFKVQ